MSLQSKRTYTLLSRLLAGDAIEDLAKSILKLPEQQVSEDQYLDYKRGSLLKKSKAERAQQIRRMVAGFANADGGVLLIGIAGGEETDEGTQWEVTGCDHNAVGGKDLEDWTSDVLKDLAPHVVPFPRIETIQHDKGPVLVIAVERAPNLVPCREHDGIKFYLRVGSSTHPVPQYLHTDLVLGRRQRADLDVNGEFELLELGESASMSRRQLSTLCLSFQIENRGISWCPEGAIEIVAYVSKETFSFPDKPDRHLPSGLHSWIDVAPVTRPDAILTRLLEPRKKEQRRFEPIPPLSRWELKTEVQLPGERIKWRAALVVMPHGQQPTWAQLSATVDFREWKIDDPEVQTLGPSERPALFAGKLTEWDDMNDEPHRTGT